MNNSIIINNPIILSFDVGLINLSYCLLTKKKITNINLEEKINYDKWDILEWDIIDLTNRNEQKCYCGNKAIFSNIIDNNIKYYCRKHSKLINTSLVFENYYEINNNNLKKCSYKNECSKKAKYININNNNYYCNIHAKQLYKNDCNCLQLKPFKFKNSKLLNFDDLKYNLIMELEKRNNLLLANYVVIENQPSFKNPKMKSIASTIYDYYLIRGIVDKNKYNINSNIIQVKFMSPSNKLKLANEGDTAKLIKLKKENETKSYKLTKELGIKYCINLITHLDEWLLFFNNNKKKDDLADAFLQGAYFYDNNFNKECIKKIIKNTGLNLINYGL